nr:gamma-tubulin complex component 4 isoform X3 [Equus asinus]
MVVKSWKQYTNTAVEVCLLFAVHWKRTTFYRSYTQTCKIILAVCHGVMYKQLSAWMLHGLLLDQHEEFFVKQGPSSGNVSAQPEEDEEDLGIGGLTGKQLRELQDLRLIEEENMLAPSLKQFSLRVEVLPSYIPVRVAEKILFVGESVQMFENQNVNLTRKGSILKNQEDTFAAELHRLKQQPLFSLVDFEQVVDRIRSTVAEHLWKLMVEESDLLGQLKIIKDFYLLGRGELFQAFIDTAQHMLKTPPTAVTEHDVNVAFQQSAHKVLLDDDNLLPLLHLTIEYHGKEHKDATQAREGPSRETSPREAPASGWAALGLSYKVQWPLHILFTPAVLEKYNVVFKYLLSVRRVQAELQHCWALQMQRKHLKSNQTDAVKWRLRNHMAFLVDNLQYYLQVDVLESQFSQLLHQINSTRDFESIRLAHDHFLSNLLAQSFILLKPVFHCLNEILDLCHSFCSLVSQNLGPLDERGAAQLSILVKGFSRQSSLLFKILSSVRNHQINSDLAQLLLRLDYNKYYTQAGGTLGSWYFFSLRNMDKFNLSGLRETTRPNSYGSKDIVGTITTHTLSSKNSISCNNLVAVSQFLKSLATVSGLLNLSGVFSEYYLHSFVFQRQIKGFPKGQKEICLEAHKMLPKEGTRAGGVGKMRNRGKS